MSNIPGSFMIWWYWILLGLFLAAIEIATPGGFFVIFFAVAALIVGLLDVLGILESDALQWGLFSVLSLVCLAFFRKPLLERMNQDVTVHGFRSAFRDWAAERTSYAHEVCEMALAHTIANKSEAAYRRGDLFDKRRRLMSDWAVFCGTTQAVE